MVRNLLRIGLAASSLMWLVTAVPTAAQSVQSPSSRSTKLIFLLPDGFTGWVCIDFGIAGAPPLPRDGDARIIRPHPGAVLKTSDTRTESWLYGEVWYGVNGRRKLLPDDVTLEGTRSLSNSTSSAIRECAFVGTIDERDAACQPPDFDKNASRRETIPASERQALIALYKSANGDHWKHRVGWLGAEGSECDWHGVTCEPSGATGSTASVVGLDLEQNDLSGSIPGELGQLTQLQSLSLFENQLSGTIPASLGDLGKLQWLKIFGNNFSGLLPDRLLQMWLAGGLDISAEAHLLTDVTEIDFQSSAPSVLCGRYRYILKADASVTSYALRCRNKTPQDRSEYCEVKEGRVRSQDFARLAWFIEKARFFDLAAKYDRAVTHATFEDLRVTRNGQSYAVSDYAEAGPLELWTIHRAIERVSSSAEWKKSKTQQTCPRW
jgi:hypothetical protein